MKTRHATPLVNAEDLAKRRTWVEQFLTDATRLPISFVLDGQKVHGIPAEWEPTAVTRRLDANLLETVFEGRDPQSGLRLRVECTVYQNHPVVEWLVWFSNHGDQPTPLLSDILALDGVFTGTSPVIYHCNGDFNSAEGYTPQETPLRNGESLVLTPRGGRPCDGAFPYTRMHFDQGGLSLAIGWPGQWSASFEVRGIGSVDSNGEGVQVRAGQEITRLRLQPEESIRTPRMTLLFWAGDDSRAINLWRRWYLAHIMPRPNGQPMHPRLACAGTDEGEEFTAATEENQKRFMDKFRQEGLDFDTWWIDAGWYPCYNQDHVRKWPITGTWEPDSERFPRGLKPVSDHAAKNGADLLLWFEPERVRPGTKLAVEHAEWLMPAEGTENRLFYLGNPDARQWLTDHVCQLIQDNGIKIYRQDFNFPPLAHWRQNEAQDRQGMNENLHVQGYLQFWDDLLARNPGLWIDSCSSGGRRNDLETMRRSVPLHYSDYGYGNHRVKLGFQHTLYAWIPYCREVTLSWDKEGVSHVEPYGYYCGLAAMLSVGMDVKTCSDTDFALARRMVAIWRRASDLLLYGDYYPLTPFSHSNDAWVVRQFDQPESGHGFLLGVRLADATQEHITAHPQGLDAQARYRFENGETGETKEVMGEVLIQQGFSLELPARSGIIWFYQQVD